MEVSSLSDDLRRRIDGELADGEGVLWLAQPRAGQFARRTLLLAAFGIIWTIFTVSFMVQWGSGPFGHDLGSMLFQGLFVIIGLAMIASPLWMVHKAAATAYVITDRRAIVIEGGVFSTTVRSFGPERFHELLRVERGDGSGDLIFERKAWVDSDGDRRYTDTGFFAIDNVAEVEKLLRRVASPEPPNRAEQSAAADRPRDTRFTE
jgi:hypothetical protein